MHQRIFLPWNNRFPTFGMLGFAAFIVALVSGIPLAVPFDIGNAEDSIQLILLKDPASEFFRSLHYWSAQLFLWSTLIHIFEYLILGREKQLATNVWLRLILSIFLSILVMLSGFILKGDAEGQMAREIFSGLLQTLPFIGLSLKQFILGSDGNLQLVYVHHLATTSIFLWVIIIEHARKVWPDNLSYVYILGLSFLLSFGLPVGLYFGNDQLLRGPWYFIGLQELLHWFNSPIIVVQQVVAYLLFLSALPWLPAHQTRYTKIILFVLFIIYIALTINNWGFRDQHWNQVFPWISE